VEDERWVCETRAIDRDLWFYREGAGPLRYHCGWRIRVSRKKGKKKASGVDPLGQERSVHAADVLQHGFVGNTQFGECEWKGEKGLFEKT